MNYIREYYDKITSGEIVACEKIKRQYKKLVDDLDNPKDPWIFDLEKANDPIIFTETFCKHGKGEWAGKPIKLELWQKARRQAIYGFVHKDTGFRKYTEVLTVVARKNGKTTDSGGDGLYMLVGDCEAGAEIYTLGIKKDQANIAFNDMCNMRDQSSDLKDVITKRKSDLYFEATFSKAQPLASDSNTLDGLNVHYALMDEFHAWKDRNLYDVIKQATGSRRQPLISMITTAGFVRESVYDSLYDYATNVLNGMTNDDRFLAFIYELDSKDEWKDEACWIKANPNIGVSKSYEYLRDNVERAKNDRDFLKTVLVKDFNVRDTVAGSWMDFEQILNQKTFDLEDFRDTYAIAGSDLSSTTDLTASMVILQHPETKEVCVHGICFIPEDIMAKKIKDDKVPYDKWVEQGLVRVCEGNTIKYSDVTKWHKELMEQHGIYVYWHGYDRWGANYWVDEMTNEGFKMEPIAQGAQTFSQPMKDLEAALSRKAINYNNNPVLKWCLLNTAIKTDKNGNIRPIKGASSRNRIDAAVALIDAWVLYCKYRIDFENLNDR